MLLVPLSDKRDKANTVGQLQSKTCCEQNVKSQVPSKVKDQQFSLLLIMEIYGH